MSNVSNLRCPLTPGLPAIVISAGLVICETNEWNDHGAVKPRSQPAPEWTKNQPTNQNQPIKKKKNLTTNQITHQLSN